MLRHVNATYIVIRMLDSNPRKILGMFEYRATPAALSLLSQSKSFALAVTMSSDRNFCAVVLNIRLRVPRVE